MLYPKNFKRVGRTMFCKDLPFIAPHQTHDHVKRNGRAKGQRAMPSDSDRNSGPAFNGRDACIEESSTDHPGQVSYVASRRVRFYYLGPDKGLMQNIAYRGRGRELFERESLAYKDPGIHAFT